MTQRPISEYLSPEMKTIIEYDCIPTYANILAASIIDMDENRVVKSFGIKKGIEINLKLINQLKFSNLIQPLLEVSLTYQL